MVLVVKNLPANTGDLAGFNSCVGKLPWRRAWQPTLVLLPGESHGQWSLASYNQWGQKELDTTEATYTHMQEEVKAGVTYSFLNIIDLNNHLQRGEINE